MSGSGLLLRFGIVLILVVVLLLRRRRPSVPAVPPAPAGPDQLGTFRTLSVRTPITPAQAPAAPPVFGSTASSPFDTPQPLSPEEAEELGKLDSLRASGTLTEEAYQQARARVLGTAPTAGWTVTVFSAGANKITAIKAIREVRRDLGLKEVKDFVDALPQRLFTGLPQADAERVGHYLEQAGVSVRLGRN